MAVLTAWAALILEPVPEAAPVSRKTGCVSVDDQSPPGPCRASLSAPFACVSRGDAKSY